MSSRLIIVKVIKWVTCPCCGVRPGLETQELAVFPHSMQAVMQRLWNLPGRQEECRQPGRLHLHARPQSQLTHPGPGSG